MDAFFYYFYKKFILKKSVVFFLLFSSVLVFSQEEKKISIDSLYREDQIYATISLNLVQNKPIELTQHALSSGISFGFLRDMPINKNRTWAIAPGLGYSYSNLKNNLKVSQINDVINYTFENNFDKNKLVLHQLELPVEIRWRSSTFESHKFWRIYTGFKVTYLFASKSEYKSSTESITVRNNSDLSKIKYGAYLSVGNNTGNIYAYYALSPLFNNVKVNNENLNLSSFNIGLVFYIL